MIRNRDERLQIMLEPEELRAVEDFRFKYRLPSRAAAVRELMRRGLRGQKTGEADDGSEVERFWRVRHRQWQRVRPCRERLKTIFYYCLAALLVRDGQGTRAEWQGKV